MSNDWATTYREGCIASDSREIVSALWIAAPSGSEGEQILGRVVAYLHDRCMIDLEFSMIRAR